MIRGMVVTEEDRCKGCGLCVDVCPSHILALAEGRFNSKGYTPIEVIDPDGCTGCAVCAIICPDVVFEVYREKKKSKKNTEAA